MERLMKKEHMENIKLIGHIKRGELKVSQSVNYRINLCKRIPAGAMIYSKWQMLLEQHKRQVIQNHVKKKFII